MWTIENIMIRLGIPMGLDCKPNKKLTNKKRMAILESLVIEERGYLFRYAMTLTFNENDALDLLQDTFEKACKYFDSFEVGTNFRAWSYRIMKNTFINTYHLKKKRYKKRLGRSEMIAEWTHSDEEIRPDTAQEFMSGYEGIDPMIRTIVEEVHGKYRDTLFLFMSGLKYGEIAKVMDCPIGTVMSRLRRAREHTIPLIQAEPSITNRYSFTRPEND